MTSHTQKTKAVIVRRTQRAFILFLLFFSFLSAHRQEYYVGRNAFFQIQIQIRGWYRTFICLQIVEMEDICEDGLIY